MLPDTFFKIKPWDHQREGIERSRSSNEFGFFYEVGTGKTLTCINALRVKFVEHKRLLNTLIVGPPIILENWKREIIANSSIDPRDIVILYGKGTKRIEALEKIIEKGHPKIVITNYESLTMGATRDRLKKKRFSGPLLNKLLEWAPEILVLDESHRCKSGTTYRSQEAVKLADKTLYRYILTGTPILNNLMDIFTQFRILDRGKTFGQNFFVFRGKYFKDKNAGMSKQNYFPLWVPKEGASDVINKLIARKSMFVEKKDCLDLPPLVKQTLTVKMSTAQAKAYESMKKHFIAYIDDKAAVAELALTKALRLQQIVSGFVNVEEGAGIREAKAFKDNPRVEALADLLEDIAPSNKVIVWAVFRENYKDIRSVCEKLKLNYVEIHGDISGKHKQDNVDAFNNDSECRVLIGHPGSGGIGINLVASNYSIFYSRSFSLEYDIQAEARNYRGGSERHEKVTRIDLVTVDTIDEQVVQALASKKKIGLDVLRDMVT